MSYSDITVANLALLKLGQPRIASFNDANRTASAIGENYPLLRDKLQRVWRWSFTRTYALLPASATPPLFQYNYAYALPQDCLRLEIASVGGNEDNGLGLPGVNLSDYVGDEQTDYKLVGRMIYTWVAPPLKIVYAASITDPNQWDPAFMEAFACYLAWQLCEQITGSGARKQSLQQDYMQSMKEARQTNAVELAPVAIGDDTFMAARQSC